MPGRAARSDAHDGVEREAWQRLALLMSFVVALPHEQAVALPLLVLPPNRLRLLNPAQGLAGAGHADAEPAAGHPAAAPLGEAIVDARMRHDFSRFVSALLPRVLDAARADDPTARRFALEDAWRDALVMRCWARVALALGESGCDQLLQRGCADIGARARWLPREAATDGWALHTRGRVAPPAAVTGASVLPLRPRAVRGASAALPAH